MENAEIYEMSILQSVRGRADNGYDLPGNPGGGMTGCTGYLQPNPLPEQIHTEEEILDLGWGHFDLIVATSNRDYVRRALHTLNNKGYWNRDRISERLVICDGEDTNWIDRDFLNTWKPRALFKREMTRDHSIPTYWSEYNLPVMPLQFGTFLRSLPKIDDEFKDRDFYVSLGRTNPIRDKFISCALDAVYEKQICHPDNAWIATNDNSPLVTEHRYGKELHNLSSWTDYMVRQGRSKIGASLLGFGRDCLHSWELFSFATLVLYQDTGLHIPHPFIDGRHCRYIREDEFPVLHHILQQFLEEDEWRMAVAKAGRDWCHLHHSTRARAEYLTEVAMKIIGGGKIDPEAHGL